MNRRTAFAAAAVAAVVIVTGGAAAVVNLGLLQSRPAEAAGQMSPVADATREAPRRRPKVVVVKPKSKPRQTQVVTIPGSSGATAASVARQATGGLPAANTAPAPAAAATHDEYDDDEYDDAAEDAAEDEDEDEDGPEVDEDGPEDDEDEHEGADDDD